MVCHHHKCGMEGTVLVVSGRANKPWAEPRWSELHAWVGWLHEPSISHITQSYGYYAPEFLFPLYCPSRDNYKLCIFVAESSDVPLDHSEPCTIQWHVWQFSPVMNLTNYTSCHLIHPLLATKVSTLFSLKLRLTSLPGGWSFNTLQDHLSVKDSSMTCCYPCRMRNEPYCLVSGLYQ